jgi:hypothetical protein
MKDFLVKYFFIILLLFATASHAQDSCHLRISLLTCTPGTELYSSFGHSALRVVDSTRGSDIIFNYGTFDFDDPHFYSKFLRGKLLYFVSIDQFADFMEQYKYEQRGVIDQVLNLDCTEKQKLLAALYENAQEANKYYKYDFVYDNCTTRLRDIVAQYANDSLYTKEIRPDKGVTFRNLIHEYLLKNGAYWSKLGIDILLGMPVDKKISNNEAMFLPDYLLKAFDSTQTGGHPLVKEKQTLLTATYLNNRNPLFSPFVLFGLLFSIVALISFSKPSRGMNRILLVFDVSFFFLCGLMGFIILFMWFGTEHTTTKNNFNLLWALPTHFVMALLIPRKKEWLKKYFRFVLALSILLLLSWVLLPQELNPSLLFITGIAAVRSYFISKKNNVYSPAI